MNTNQTYDIARARSFFQDKMAFTTGPVELEHMLKSGEGIAVIDVREAEDYAKSRVPGAINVPKSSWDNPQGLQMDKTNIVYCYTQNCHLAANACSQWAAKGFRVMEMDGGFEAWKEADLDTEGEPENRLKRAGEKLLHRRH